jgi:hypothetical protein
MNKKKEQHFDFLRILKPKNEISIKFSHSGASKWRHPMLTTISVVPHCDENKMKYYLCP